MAGKGSKKQITLTQALAAFLGKVLLPDLKARAADEAVDGALKRQWEAEKAAKRTADGYPAWRDRTLEQIGAAWVLSCVFVRTLEDRDLLARRRLAGAGALDSEQLFFELAPSLTARDYLLTVFREVSSLPGAEELLGAQHNPLWRLGPSAEVARALLGFFRQEDEKGGLVWRFDGADTRFLGDLYQDLSEDVRKRYALLQTPDFVERFILGETLDPAIAEFGLEAVRVIDPTCGSGHFLLGAFDRLLNLRLQNAPGVDVRDHAVAALSQVYGVDVNPYAVAIARFRLTLAYLQRTGIAKLAQAPRLPLNLVVADSLLHGAGVRSLFFSEHSSASGAHESWGAEMFALADEAAAAKVLGNRFHAVVGNPPYITPKDKALRDGYREFYKSCYREYALAAPFTERFFQLAVDGGFVGLINANSFMKREFGKALIEKVLPHVELTRVVDTSGAHIPGHETPTVILFGRNRRAVSSQVAAVLGKRGEPSKPDDAEQGFVWRSIAVHGTQLGFDNDYISVANVPRATFAKHPWSLGGGGAADLKALIEERAAKRLSEIVDSIGFGAISGEDNVFLLECGVGHRLGLAPEHMRPLVAGEVVRDWMCRPQLEMVWPCGANAERLDEVAIPDVLRFFWAYRTVLHDRKAFGLPIKARGIPWWAVREVYKERFRTPLTITFAFVATHNHFVLDRGGKVFKQSAPIIKLPESATEDDHLALLAYLNSSTACFWMKQVCHNKGGEEKATRKVVDGNVHFVVDRGQTGGGGGYEFSGTALLKLPLPTISDTDRVVLIGLAREAESIANERAKLVTNLDLSDADAITRFRAATTQLLAIQDEIDWVVYGLFGLHDGTDEKVGSGVIGHPSARAFETRLAQSNNSGAGVIDPDGRLIRSNFTGTHPSIEELWKQRILAIDASTNLAIVEDFPYKRRPTMLSELDARTDLDPGRSFEKARRRVRLERRLDLAEQLRSQTLTPTTIGSIEPDRARHSELLDESVPFVAELVFSENGLEKHAAWRRTWDLQRREDLGEAIGEIPVPPKYDQKDFRDANYWRLRGKLDVPKERFISYPGCQKDGDPSPLIGWAGWNHLQRAQALVALYQERKTEDAWPKERLMPMLVGLHELMFWLDLWHSKPEAGSQNPAREFKQFLDAELHAHALTTDDLEAWRPTQKLKKTVAPRTGRGRKAAPEAGSEDEGVVT